jgi:hypothetical protein
MNTRTSSKIVGIFFILAAISSIIGLALYNPILNGSDYLSNGAAHSNEIILGAVLELILVVTAVGTATTMFPILRKHNETVALWHLCFRFLEAVIIVIGIISVLSLLTLSKVYVATINPNITDFQASGEVLKAIHDWTFLLGPNFMLGINTFMYSFIFYKSRLIHKFIPKIGMTGAILTFLASILEMFGVINQVSVWGALMSLPVFVNEMTLAIYLIAKGFKE